MPFVYSNVLLVDKEVGRRPAPLVVPGRPTGKIDRTGDIQRYWFSKGPMSLAPATTTAIPTPKRGQRDDVKPPVVMKSMATTAKPVVTKA